MAAIVMQPTAPLARVLARSSPLSCAPGRVQLPAIGQRRLLQVRTWSSPPSDLARVSVSGSRASQLGVRPVCAIGLRLFSTSRVCRAADDQQPGDPQRNRNHNQTPQPKKPLIEKTKELRNQLKSLKTHEQIWNLPNVLTFSRLVAAPLVGYFILHDHHAWALGLFAYAGITDLLDGWIARRWKLQTVVGSVVDPMADKLLMAITVGCLAAKGALPGPLAILIFGRDASLAIAAIYFRYASLPSPKTFARYWDFSLPSAEVHPTTVSKFNTFLQLALVGLTLLFPVLASFSPSSASDAAAITDAAEGHERSESKQSLTSAALYKATDAETLSSAVTALQVLVGATTVWSGFSYAVLKNAVTILGSNEALKRRQGARGRAIIGASFGLVCLSAVWWAVKKKQQEDEEKKRKEQAH